MISIACGCIVASGLVRAMPFYEGFTNRDGGDLLNIRMVMIGGLIVILALVLLLVLAILWAGQRRYRWSVGATLTLGITIAAMYCVLHFVPVDTYERGFHDWIDKHINESTVDAIRQWDLRQPTTERSVIENEDAFTPAAPSESPQVDWPPAIFALSPHRVTRLANGVVMEWGIFGTWGTARRVFISDTELQSCDDGSGTFRYAKIRPLLWAAIQDPG